jgi:hypothetical protein
MFPANFDRLRQENNSQESHRTTLSQSDEKTQEQFVDGQSMQLQVPEGWSCIVTSRSTLAW